MLSAVLCVALTALPGLPELTLELDTSNVGHSGGLLELTAAATGGTPGAVATGPWAGERGRDRIVGLALTGTGAGLGLLSLAFLATASSYQALSGPYSRVPGTAGPAMAAPYWFLGLTALGGAVVFLVLGVPRVVRGFSLGAPAPSSDEPEPRKAPVRRRPAPSTV